MKKINLTLFESEILKLLLAGEDPVIIALRDQLEEVAAIQRELTGVGFYLNFDLPQNIKRVDDEYNIKPNFCFGDVQAIIPSLKFGAGFLLWIKNGVLSSLEGYTYDEEWPVDINEFQIKYINGNQRDWEYLHRQWSLSPLSC